MPESLRPVLARGAGELVSSVGSYLETAVKALRVISECSLIIAVGDIACVSIAKAGVVPDVCIIDLRTRRNSELPDSLRIDDRVYGSVIKAWNPASLITEEALNAVKTGIDNARAGIKTLIIIDGEEDLLTLPATIYAMNNECIIYGKPDEGLAIIKVNESIRREAVKLFSQFKKVEVNIVK